MSEAEILDDLGRILAWVQDEQLEGRLVDRDGAVRAVRDRYPVPNQEPPTDA